MLFLSLGCILTVCVCVCACACSMCKEQNRLQIMVFSSSTHSLGFGGFLPLSFVNFNKHFLFIQHSYHSFFTFCPSLSTFYVTLFSLSFPPSLTHFSFLSLIYSMFLHFLFLQEPQTTVIHNPADRRKVYIIPQTSPILYPLCHSPPLPHCLLLYDPSF